MELLHHAMGHNHDIDFARWLHPAMWHVALESWQWIYQMAALCMWHIALGSWHWTRQVAALCNVTVGSGMTCNWIRPNVHHIGKWLLVSIGVWPYHCSPHDILHQSVIFYPNRTTIGRKNSHVDFQDGGSPLSWTFGVQAMFMVLSSWQGHCESSPGSWM